MPPWVALTLSWCGVLSCLRSTNSRLWFCFDLSDTYFFGLHGRFLSHKRNIQEIKISTKIKQTWGFTQIAKLNFRSRRNLLVIFQNIKHIPWHANHAINFCCWKVPQCQLWRTCVRSTCHFGTSTFLTNKAKFIFTCFFFFNFKLIFLTF